MLALGKLYSVGEIILVPNRMADAPSEPLELERQPYETGFVERPYKDGRRSSIEPLPRPKGRPLLARTSLVNDRRTD
jgi:hypothetical protein